ncbi:MAG: glycosyltransferase family 4 protein [Oscillospiraceae bacterium]|nr:glycosyltransferase family 4 protein [Oscillospiraceae bacterium]
MKRKIIEVSTDTNIGGAGKCLIALLENFDYSKFAVKVILPPDSLLKSHIELLGIEVIEVPGIAEKSLDIKSIHSLKKIFKAEKPDLVHTHASMSARIAARHAGAKVVYTRHSVFPPSKYLTSFPGRQINGMFNNYYSDGIIAVAEAAKDNLTDTGVDASKIRVILNGVAGLKPVDKAEKQRIRDRFAIPDGDKVISIVARLEDIKGHDYFIEAASMLLRDGIKAKFMIAGTGSYESQLKAKVKRLGLEKDIIFTGFISDVDKLMSITDIQVNASYGTEATSLALLEGMSIGVPAVVSDFGGNPGVIKNGENGFVVTKQNSAALKTAIKKLLDDEALYASMSERSREIFKTVFTAETMTRNTENLYSEILERGEQNGKR